MDPQNLTIPRSVSKMGKPCKQRQTQPLLLLDAGLRIKALAKCTFMGVYAPPQSNKFFLYASDERNTSLLDERIRLLKETEFADYLL